MFAMNGFERQARNSAPGRSLLADCKDVRAQVRPNGTSMPAFRRSGLHAGPRPGEDGQALVEFTFVAVFVLLPLFTAIFTFGIAYSHQLTLTNAVGTGGQNLQLIRQNTSDPCKDTFSAITGAAPGLIASNIKMTITMNGNTPITNTGSANTCPGDQSELAQGKPNTITAYYPCNIAIYGHSFGNNCQLSATVTEFEY